MDSIRTRHSCSLTASTWEARPCIRTNCQLTGVNRCILSQRDPRPKVCDPQSGPKDFRVYHRRQHRCNLDSCTPTHPQTRQNLFRRRSGFSFVSNVSFTAESLSLNLYRSFPHLLDEDAICLIPCAIDQDPYFRLTRDVAPRLKYKKPALIHSKFFPGTQSNSCKLFNPE